jgi:hypothetical protein
MNESLNRGPKSLAVLLPKLFSANDIRLGLPPPSIEMLELSLF